MTTRKKFIGYSFILYLGAFYGGVNLYLNDKLRAERDLIINKGKKKQEILNIHDRLAASYEKKTDNFEFRNSFLKYRRILISYAKGKVLECGMGTGRSLEFYKDDVELIGIDYNSKMLDQAKEKLDEKDHFNISKKAKFLLTKMDCEDLKENFQENCFDTVVDINNFHCYNDYQKVYDNIKYVLKDGGIFVFFARGESDYILIRDFYRVFRPYVFMKFGQDLTINWEKYIEEDPDFKILYKDRKNYGRTYIYILQLNKNKNNIL